MEVKLKVVLVLIFCFHSVSLDGNIDIAEPSTQFITQDIFETVINGIKEAFDRRMNSTIAKLQQAIAEIENLKLQNLACSEEMPCLEVKLDNSSESNVSEQLPACSLDVMFVLDGSESISHSNFEVVKDWVKTAGQRLQENNDNVQLGVIQYSHYFAHKSIDDQPFMKTEVSLGHRSVINFSAEVDLIRYMGFTTYTAHALQLAIEDFKTSVNYKAGGNNQILILVTDGRSSDHEILRETAEEVRRLGIRPYAVGIGDATLSELHEIATGNQNSSERVSSLGDFDDLRSLALDLDIC